MEQDKNGEMVIRTRKYRVPSVSQAQTDQQAQFSHTSQSWQTLSQAGRDSYTELGSRMVGKTGKPMKGHNCYTHITETRALQGLAPLPMAPASAPPKPGPQVPSPLFLSALNNGTCQILIHAAAADTPLLLEAAPWVSAGVSYFSKSSFRVCEVLPGLAAGGVTNVTAAITSRFSVPPAGSQMVVRLTPMTEDGFRGATTVYSAFVAPTEAEMLQDLEERKAKRGRKPMLQMVA